MTKNGSILFAVPTAGTIEASTVFHMAKIAQDPRVDYIQVQGSPLDQVRNQLMRRMLANPKYDYLMMMDSDVVPPDGIVDMMLEAAGPDGMSAAIVPILLFNNLVANIVMPSTESEKGVWLRYWGDKTEPFECQAAGGGLMLISRKVAESIPWPWFKYGETPEGLRCGEDIHFANKARSYGFRYKVHPKSLCGHLKKVNLLEIVSAANRQWLGTETPK